MYRYPSSANEKVPKFLFQLPSFHFSFICVFEIWFSTDVSSCLKNGLKQNWF
eukprot:GAHX01008540.1.p2 GENE.GAHX01008540.1~~GAHX01008540.1.p2  ORF type:complete len:52 (+),score=2.20 GAHX01008540.1:178-333(+)